MEPEKPDGSSPPSYWSFLSPLFAFPRHQASSPLAFPLTRTPPCPTRSGSMCHSTVVSPTSPSPKREEREREGGHSSHRASGSTNFPQSFPVLSLSLSCPAPP